MRLKVLVIKVNYIFKFDIFKIMNNKKIIHDERNEKNNCKLALRKRL